MDHPDVLIVGAGVAGLACARGLLEAGRTVTVWERSRSLGGRCASKTPGSGPVVDFGPVFVHGDDPEFLALMESLGPGVVPGWPTRVRGSGTPCQPQAFSPGQVRFGVTGGIRRLAEVLAEGVNVVTEAEATALGWNADTVEVIGGDRSLRARHGVLAIALEQTRALLPTLGSGPDGREVRSASAVLGQFGSVPSLVVLAEYGPEVPEPEWDVWYPEQSPAILLVSNEGTKRGAPGASGPCLVIQARPGWSQARLDADREVWARDLLAEAASLVGPWVGHPSAFVTHRWRYGRLGPGDHLVRPMVLARPGSTALWGLAGDVFDPSGGLQGAWRSGRRLAARIAETLQ